MNILFEGPLFEELVYEKGYQNHLRRLGKTPLSPLKYNFYVTAASNLDYLYIFYDYGSYEYQVG